MAKRLILCELYGNDNITALIAQEVAERFDTNKRIIARTESITDLIKLYERLKEKGFTPFVYHGRLTSAQRRTVINKLIELQNSDKGFLVLATSAIEAGCDFDAHVIVTEFLPARQPCSACRKVEQERQDEQCGTGVVGNSLKILILKH
jgi:CRISPR-associated endonuclease/helicase Cas3